MPWRELRVVATSAVRDALDSEEFMAAAEEITRLRPEILSGDEEGRLSFVGATAHLPADLSGRGPVLVVDIGGGSTELVVGHNPAEHADSAPEVVVRSLDIGCVPCERALLAP